MTAPTTLGGGAPSGTTGGTSFELTPEPIDYAKEYGFVARDLRLINVLKV